jgi:gluconolactonase
MDLKDIILYDSGHAKKITEVVIQQIAAGFRFTEGPVWHPDQYLLFSDTPVNKIWQLLPDRTVQVYMDKSGLSNDDVSALSDMIGSNGLAIDGEGCLIICQHGNHGLARLQKTGETTILVNQFEGHPLNSPNDLVLHSDGAIFFTDPPYGLKNQILHPSAFQTFAGIYRCKNDKLDLLCDDLRYPNGICFSPGEDYLYVSSNHPDEPYVWRFELSGAGQVKHQSILIEQNADGIIADKEGNLLLCTDRGILFVSPHGKRLALISLPEIPTNIAWGGKDGNELYITARSSIYLATGYHNA